MKRLLSIAAFAAACVAGTAHAQEAPRPPLQTTVPIASIHIPDEIAPAVVPYLMCMSQNSGATSRGAGGIKKADVAAAVATAREKCAGVRRDAFTNGVRMIEKQGSKAEREARVEAVLGNVDAMFANIGNAFPVEPSAN